MLTTEDKLTSKDFQTDLGNGPIQQFKIKHKNKSYIMATS